MSILYAVFNPAGQPNHTTVDVREDWAVAKWMEQEQLVTRTLQGTPVSSWEGYEAAGYSVRRVHLLSAPTSAPDASAQRNESGGADALSLRHVIAAAMQISSRSDPDEWRKLDRIVDAVVSELATAAPAIPAGQRADVEALASEWEERAKIHQQTSGRTNDPSAKSSEALKADMLWHCAYQMRHLTAQPNRGDGGTEAGNLAFRKKLSAILNDEEQPPLSDVRAATDGERLDWLEKNGPFEQWGKTYTSDWTPKPEPIVLDKNIRAAIDAAMTARGRNGEGK